MNTLLRRTVVGALALTLPFGLIACSDDDDGDDASTTTSVQTTDSDGTDTTAGDGDTSMTTMDDGDAAAAGDPFGPGCAAVPDDGAGSFDGMAAEPVATAASNNPVLSTLVAAVGEADLVDTLNNAEDITVFAPTDDAFAAVDPDTLDAAMADPQGMLSDVLQAHVVAGRLTPEDVVGTHETLAGDELTVTGAGEELTVNDAASVVCGNVQTANATVYIIDAVLLPS